MSHVRSCHPSDTTHTSPAARVRGAVLAATVGLGLLVGCPGSPGEEEGVWCRDASPAIKFLLLDGLGVYSVLERDASGTVTTIVGGEPYSFLEEGDVTIWYSWIEGEPYSNVVTSLVPGQELVLDSSLFYSYVAPHDRDFDVSAVDTCPPQ